MCESGQAFVGISVSEPNQLPPASFKTPGADSVPHHPLPWPSEGGHSQLSQDETEPFQGTCVQ